MHGFGLQKCSNGGRASDAARDVQRDWRGMAAARSLAFCPAEQRPLMSSSTPPWYITTLLGFRGVEGSRVLRLRGVEVGGL